jgi:hypothetical protein
MRFVCLLLAGLVALHGALIAYDLARFILAPSLYPIGSEAARPGHTSAGVYAGISVVELMLDAGGLGLAARLSGFTRKTVALLIVIGLQCALTFVLHPAE